ncbi:beta-glucosidase [Abortiporus biennis]|nr:beta-glucosidase [Abortiporus biennis]
MYKSKLTRRHWVFIGLITLAVILFVILFPILFTTTRHHHSHSASQTVNDCSSLECAGVIFPTITPESFTPFPVPSDTPIPNSFIEFTPKNPPAVADAGKIIPDFGKAWKDAYTKAKARISGWSLEQKVNATTGIGWSVGRCVGNIPAIEDWNGLCLQDSPLGIRGVDFATAFPTGVNTGATWNRTMFRIRGQFMGAEFKGKGANVALGPMMNMGRNAQGGRNWEGFGADPFLTGEAAYETILGMQSSGVQACAKHFINNEQEHKRTMSSSNVDDRTQHEIYAHPFLRSVQAGVASVMCSYNLINDTWACDNDKMMNDVLKREFGFQGYVMSDWSAQHTTESAMAGLDMTMPGDISFGSGTSYFGQNLTAYVNNGTIPSSRVDDMATRILAAWYLLGQDQDYPPTNFNYFQMLDQATNLHVDVQDDHASIVREIGAGSAILLKNVNHTLPLEKPRSVVVVGNSGGPGSRGPNGFTDRGGDDGVLAMGWGSGTAQFPYLITPLEALQTRARQDKSSFSWWTNNFDLVGAASAVQFQDVAFVFVSADSGEDYITVDGNEGDRKNLTLWQNADNLITTVANNNKNTVVVVQSVGPAILEPWIEHPNVTAVLWQGLSGQESGNSITDVIYGDFSPSGRLPYTIAKNASDYSGGIIQDSSNDIVSVPYTEGLNIDYRHFDSFNITPRFEFGFGLSYTKFKFSNLQVSKVSHSDKTSADLEAAWAKGKAAPISVGSSAAIWLHRPAVQVKFDITNTGKVTGGEIPQLYVHHPTSAGEPPNVLKGFTDVLLKPGQTKTVTLALSRYDLSVWNVVQQGWVRPQGTIRFSVGQSSRKFKLSGTVPL